MNLEDIAAPRCFEIEKKLKQRCDILIFHDDQHGTAIVVAAALINALKVTGKQIGDIHAVFSGAGAAGTAIFKLLYSIKGVVYPGRLELKDDPYLDELAQMTQPAIWGGLKEALAGADLFVGISAPNLVTVDMVKSMVPQPIIFPIVNLPPEIMPDVALAAVVGTGCSDFPQPDQQRAGLLRRIPRRFRCACFRNQREDEAGCRSRPGEVGKS